MPMSQNFEGPLSKWTNVIHGWCFRWFVLDVQNGLLSYYTSKDNMNKGERRGCIRLKDAYVGYDKEDDITFTITVDDKTFHLQARNLGEREKWVSKIERTIRLHTLSLSSKSVRTDSSNSSNSIINKVNQGTSSNTVTNSKSNSIDYEQFDLALTESDAYLQLLIEQLKVNLNN